MCEWESQCMIESMDVLICWMGTWVIGLMDELVNWWIQRVYEWMDEWGEKEGWKGGSRGRVQGVKTPPEMKLSSLYSLLKFVYLTGLWRHYLEVHPS